jgi:membrane fusion protein (multidrug efflux system)
MKHFIALSFLLSFVLSCSKKEQTGQAPVQDIPVIKTIIKDVPIYNEFVGQAYGLQDIPIRARVEGFLEGIHFDEGRPVKKGQLLYSIDAQPFLADVATQKSRVAEAETYLVNAENELARYEPLVKINAVSKSDYDAKVARRDAEVASLDAAKSNLEISQINLSYTKIKAPIDGIIGKTEARVGEFVGKDPNPVILNTISRIDQIRVQFFVTESQYIQLARELGHADENERQKTKKDALELILSDGSHYSQKGTVDFIDRNIDAMTGSMLVQGTFPNPDYILRPGMFTKVKIQLETRKDAVLIPQRCIMELQGQYSVYVVDESKTVQARQVVVGGKVGDLWLIKEGLKEGETIVIDALQKVSSGLVINPRPTEFKSQSN